MCHAAILYMRSLMFVQYLSVSFAVFYACSQRDPMPIAESLPCHPGGRVASTNHRPPRPNSRYGQSFWATGKIQLIFKADLLYSHRHAWQSLHLQWTSHKPITAWCEISRSTASGKVHKVIAETYMDKFNMATQDRNSDEHLQDKKKLTACRARTYDRKFSSTLFSSPPPSYFKLPVLLSLSTY